MNPAEIGKMKVYPDKINGSVMAGYYAETERYYKPINEIKMGVTKFDLRLGNIFEQGIVCKINGRTGAKVHVYGKLKWKKGLRVIESVAVEDLKPIALSPQVLVEWCGFIHKGDGEYEKENINLMYDGQIFTEDWIQVNLAGLHELQNLWYILKKKELEIKE